MASFLWISHQSSLWLWKYESQFEASAGWSVYQCKSKSCLSLVVQAEMLPPPLPEVPSLPSRSSAEDRDLFFSPLRFLLILSINGPPLRRSSKPLGGHVGQWWEVEAGLSPHQAQSNRRRLQHTPWNCSVWTPHSQLDDQSVAPQARRVTWFKEGFSGGDRSGTNELQTLFYPTFHPFILSTESLSGSQGC